MVAAIVIIVNHSGICQFFFLNKQSLILWRNIGRKNMVFCQNPLLLFDMSTGYTFKVFVVLNDVQYCHDVGRIK
jgi:hypothetical protein